MPLPVFGQLGFQCLLSYSRKNLLVAQRKMLLPACLKLGIQFFLGYSRKNFLAAQRKMLLPACLKLGIQFFLGYPRKNFLAASDRCFCRLASSLASSSSWVIPGSTSICLESGRFFTFPEHRCLLVNNQRPWRQGFGGFGACGRLGVFPLRRASGGAIRAAAGKETQNREHHSPEANPDQDP